MIPQKKRLSKSRVAYVLKKGTRLRLQQKDATPFFNVTYLHNRNGFNRFCVIVSSKTAAKATERNSIRRKVYEAIREHQENAPKPQTASDIALIVKAPVKEQEYTQLKNILASILEEIPHS